MSMPASHTTLADLEISKVRIGAGNRGLRPLSAAELLRLHVELHGRRDLSC